MSLNYRTQCRGFGLAEFIISMALSLAAILVVTSIYVTSFSIDSKTVRYSKLNDEVNSTLTLLAEDIRRAGYVANAEQLITSTYSKTNTSRCQADSTGCSDTKFRDIEVGNYAGEVANSCILFAYDINDNGTYDDGSGASDAEAFGYRLREGQIEVRKGENKCADGGWESISYDKFVTISGLTFTCSIDSVVGCAAASLPAAAAGNNVVTVDISFTATLVDDPTVSIQASDTVMVRNASYN